MDGGHIELIIDERNKSINLIRDRIGLKPAYYSKINGTSEYIDYYEGEGAAHYNSLPVEAAVCFSQDGSYYSYKNFLHKELRKR